MEEDQILSWPAFFFLDNFSFYKFCLFMCRLVTKMNIGLRISWENKCSQRRRELRQVGGGWGWGVVTISEGHIACNYTKKIAPLMNS